MIKDLEAEIRNLPQGAYKSKGEARIAHFLNDYGIPFIYEHPLAVLDEGKTKIWHPDFYLPDHAAHIEYFGLAGQPDYDAGIRRKQAVYNQMRLEVIGIYPQSFQRNWQGYILGRLEHLGQYRLGQARLAGARWNSGGHYHAQNRYASGHSNPMRPPRYR